MTIKRITVIIPVEMLPKLEARLREIGVPGVTVERVQGYGEHANFFRRDLMRENVRVILYADSERESEFVDAIKECAKAHEAACGILVVEPVDRIVNLTNGRDEIPE